MSVDDVIGRIAFGPPMSMSELRLRSHQLGSADMALVTAKLKARVAALEETLRTIQGWDCLNPPDPNLCADHPWLKRLVDDALAHALSPTQRAEGA